MSKLFKLTLIILLLALFASCTPQTAVDTDEEPTEAPEETTEPEPTAEVEETEAPEPTAEVEETEAPEATTEPAGGFEAIDPFEADCEGGQEINTITAVDQYTVEFGLCRPDPAFREKIAFSSFAIQSSEWLEETGGGGDLLTQPVGTGPYMVSEWNRGESITFTRFDDYWGEPALSERLVFRWSTEAAARLLELQSGEVDGIDNVGPEDIETVQGDANLQLIERPALNIFYIAFTPVGEGSPFDDVRVRQAVAMGIDRERIVDTFYPPGSEVASHFTPCEIANGCTGDPWYDFDPERALELMEEAGYADGFDTKLYYRDVVRGYLPNVNQVAQDIQAQLAENLGINAEIEVMESGTFIEAASQGQLTDGIHLLGWGADYPQITNFLDYHFNQNNPQFGTPHPEIYEPLLEGAQIADPEEAEGFYVEANNAVRELVPMVPVAHGASALAFQANIEGAHASPLGNEYFSIMSPGDDDTFVWMQNGEPPSLFCADESDGEALRACEQVTESLLAYEHGSTPVVPSLATSCDPNDDLTVWTCTLREGVLFHDGTTFDANDVVFNLTVLFDASHGLHVGNTGSFDYPAYFFGLVNIPEG